MVDCRAGESFAPGQEATTLLEDWVTIWQSELAGLVLDRELHEALLRLVDNWAAQARAILATAPPLDPVRLPGAIPPPGPTTANAASNAGELSERDASVARLHQRIAELERRLARFKPPGT